MRDANEYFLESYHYVGKESAVKKMRRDGVKVFLDSGAYSASTQGITIDVGRYCDYILRNQDIISMAASLDVLKADTPMDAARQGYKNLCEMERRGVKVVPTFHQGEPEDMLEYYVSKYDYVLLGGMVGSSVKQLALWLDRVFERYLTNGDGTLKTRIHLFGVTSLPLMLRYNATSVDSSTWVQWAAMGMILLPYTGKQLNISSQSPFRKQTGQHLDSLRPIEREACEREIAQCGADAQRLRDLYYARWAFNCWAFPKYLELRADQKSDKFKAPDPVLF
ncbi:queuine tRNA-ribosyltransferase [Synechococcus phage Ssp-JY38]|nr:queuine tRNA-ribosyltransferase [Synechococcus phage Yong-L2-223]